MYPAAGNFKLFEALDGPNSVDDFFCDLARSLAQLLASSKARGRQTRPVSTWAVLDDDSRQSQAVGAVQEIVDFLRQTALQMTIQESL